MRSHGCQIILIDNLRLEDLAVVEIAIVICHMVVASVCKSVNVIHWLLIAINKVFRSSKVSAHQMLIHVWVFLRLYSMCNLILVVHMLLHH